MRSAARMATTVAATLLALALVGACGDDSESDADSDGNGGDTSESSGDCFGATSGEITLLASGPVSLPGGGSAGVGSVESDEDPPVLNLLLGGGSATEQEDATKLEVGDTFTFEGATYSVQGFCEDKAYLTQSAG
jgi:hypothetical protein